MAALDPKVQAAIVQDPQALDCTLYRPDERNPDEELDLGDARVVITGPFQAPAEWDARDREEYFDGSAEEAFVVAEIACVASNDSGRAFRAEPGDYAAVMETPAQVAMFFVYDCLDHAAGRYVLIRDEATDLAD